MTIDQLKMDYFEGVYKTKALLIKEQPITLQSGMKSHIYLNHRHFYSNSKYLSLVAHIYHTLAQSITTDYVLGAVDSIMSPLIVGAMSMQFHKNTVIVKKSLLNHGTQETIFGDASQNTVLIDDMTSTGDTLIDAALKIREKGGIVNYAIISAYRDKSAIINLQKHNIHLLAIASFEEILQFLQPKLSTREKSITQDKPLIFI